MRYGFVIDHNRCIGCHACTVACKEEHNVPLGVFRTWVKYIEKGEFPHAKRYFAVLRCNHCDDAPCIQICPTVALFRRPDGIVDFDSDRCIGCKSCMQACPYDALYIDPNSHTAAKCNFCAHRIELGLEPACVIVCPEQAIVAGDLDNPASQISRLVATEKVSMRKPEKGTRPKLFYLGVEGSLLQPTMVRSQGAHFWAEKAPMESLVSLSDGETTTPGTAREVYDVAHAPPWGEKIASYLWAKSLAAGVLLIAALLLGMGYGHDTLVLNVTSPVLALFFLALTTLLLIFDLKRPERFYYLLTKPNSRSWLVWGGYILLLYGLMAFSWLLFGLTGGSIPRSILWSTALLAICSACYSAFLFAQAKGRDLWQSPLFIWHLLFQAMTAGGAILIFVAAFHAREIALMKPLGRILTASLSVSLAMILAEVWLPHLNENVRRAAGLLTKGTLSLSFWGFAIGLGGIFPLLLLFWNGFQEFGTSSLYILASLSALIGLWFFDHLWIKAGQAVPLS